MANRQSANISGLKENGFVESDGRGATVLDFGYRIERRNENGEGTKLPVASCKCESWKQYIDETRNGPSTSLKWFPKKRLASAIITDDSTKSRVGNSTLTATSEHHRAKSSSMTSPNDKLFVFVGAMMMVRVIRS